MLRPGERLGSFLIETALGHGGMGSVYAAVDERLGRRVAIKVVGAAMATPDGRRRLIREARLMATVDHPGIVQIYELGEREDEVYIVMELVRGRSFAGLLGELGPLPPRAVAAAGVGIARATAAAHEAGILHRDIKPMNVMLRHDGMIKVLDFGIAKPADPSRMTAFTKPGNVSGTPSYLAPELLNGAASTVAADVWALGITLVELATGDVPFKSGSLVELIVSVTGQAPDLTGVPSDSLRAVIDRALTKNPAARFASMEELARALEPIADTAALMCWSDPALAPLRVEPSQLVAMPPPGTTDPGFPPVLVAGKPGKSHTTASFANTFASDLPPPGQSGSIPAVPAAPRLPAALASFAPPAAPPLDTGLPSSPSAALAIEGARAGALPDAEVIDEIAGKLSMLLQERSTAPGAATSAPAAPASGSSPRITIRSGSKPLNEEVLDDLAGRLATLPEPLALLATNVEVARADGDSTGIRKRLFELGVGVVRYAVSTGLAVVRARLAEKNKKAPGGLGGALRKAARMSDGQWADLGRAVASELRAVDPGMMRALKFLSEKPLADLIASRNLFIHGGAYGDDAPERTLAVLESADELCALELRLVASVDPPAFEARRGTPIRAGVWRKAKGALPPEVRAGEAYLIVRDAWVQATPWLPLVDGRLLLVDSPHAAGKPWRSMDPESGEHREHAPLDQTLKGFLEADASAPIPLTDRPALVGRGAVLSILKRAAEEAVRGGIRVVMLTGPFGIGRSHVAHTVVSSSTGLGFARLLNVSCSPERRSTLRPILRALEGAEGMERILEAAQRAVAGDVLARREGIEIAVEAVEEAFVEASLGAPLLLVVDDVQWADDQTLSLLRLLTERASRGGRGQLMVVVTARDEPSPTSALRRLLGQAAQEVGLAAVRVALPALAEKDAALVVRGVAPIEPDVERALVRGAAGMPFFLVQPLLVWSETGMLVWKEKAWGVTEASSLDAAVPGVGDLVRARLTSFFDPGSDAERAAHQALACVALYGSGLPLRHAVTAMVTAGASEAAAEHALEALIEASLLCMAGDRQEIRFAQSIVEQALLSDLTSKTWFRRVHRALLDATAASEDAEADASFLAAGYEALGAHAEALAWLKKGVARAFATGSFDDAVALGERLARLSKLPSDRLRGDLAVAEALLRLGRAMDARARLELFAGVAPAGTEGAIETRILSLAIAHASGDVPAEPDPLLLADADACGQPRLGIEARLVLATCLRGARGLALVEEGVRRLAALDEGAIGDLRYRLLALRLEILWESRTASPADYRLAAKLAGEAARALGSAWAELDMDMNVAALESDAGNHETAITLLKEIELRAGELHFSALRTQALVSLAGGMLRAGQPAEAAEAAERAATVAREAGSTQLGTALSIQADALFQVRRLPEAHAVIEEAARLKLAENDPNVAVTLLRRAEIAAAMGETESAMADADLALARAQQSGSAEHISRVRIWTAIHGVTSELPGAIERLAEVVASVEPLRPMLRASTRQMLDRAAKLLEERRPPASA